MRTTKRDIVWNYVGTLMSMGGSFFLLPVLLYFLSPEELGLWYSFLAVSNLTQLFEFGFNPTFARNIVYVISGARELAKEGEFKAENGINIHLLASLLKSAKIVYAALGILAFIVVATIGSYYVGLISSGINGYSHWISWGIFCLAIFLNLYFLWTLTYLRGFGDIAGENQAKTAGKISQVVVTLVLCAAGFGLVGAAVAYLMNGLVMRMAASKLLANHGEIMGRASRAKINSTDIRRTLSDVSHLAIKDGVVELSLFSATQGTSILCSLFLGLRETGVYSLGLQLASAVMQCAKVYISSFYPAYQSAYAVKNDGEMKKIISNGVSAFWVLSIVGTLSVAMVLLPLLGIIKPGTNIDVLVFFALSLYCCLNEQHSIFCALIAATNRIPYMSAYAIAAAAGLLISATLMEVVGIGVWGLILGQALAQVAYNNWKWPGMVLKELNYSPLGVLRDGLSYWKGAVIDALPQRQRREM